MSDFDFKPGSLVTLRNRPWVVLPSDVDDLLLIKPLGGTDEEITGIFKPLASSSDQLESYSFVKPSDKDIGDFQSARLLYDAARLSFRNAAGPFRCLGKLSFRPRSYQMVPMVMALKQDVTRLLIADDVGVGKTIEALLIAKELYERKVIRRFAIVCLPPLCDQWQDELKNKFGIEAIIVRSGTVSAIERQIRTNENIFRAFPFQIISIDYIKSGNKRQVFIDHCPEFIIVDEAHSCARPAGANNSQQLRYHLIHDIARKEGQHLVLLTATPHSGKQEEFQSLLGLLKPEFEKVNVLDATQFDPKTLARYFIQRRRGDVLKWLDEETRFPKRIPIDMDYQIGATYVEVFDEVLSYAREIVARHMADRRKQRLGYWEALALLRGVMSSPAAGVSMLTNKANKKQVDGDDDEAEELEREAESERVMDADYASDDSLPVAAIKLAPAQDSEARLLRRYAEKLSKLSGVTHDLKARKVVEEVKKFMERGFNPVIFCRYIQTANYLGDVFKEALRDKRYREVHLEVITSELDDELRKSKIDEMNRSARRLLIATDCLSEGINLQEGFNAMVHYDLPWNPNRLEQREGRIDRFGQQAESVEVGMLYGKNNPIDGVVLEVLLRKAQKIRKDTGIAVPFPEKSASVMETLTKAILLKPTISVRQISNQLTMFEDEEIEAQKSLISKALDEAERREKASRSIFAQNAIKANEIEADLREVDEAIGDVKTLEKFVLDALAFMDVKVEEKKDGYKWYTTNLPQRLRQWLTSKPELLISFKSPTPAGYQYLGRNHPFTEHLCQYILNSALQGNGHVAARTAVLRTTAVKEKTVLLQLRARNVIAEQPSNKEIVAEEMWLWGYEGALKERRLLSKETGESLLRQARAASNMENEEQAYWLTEEMGWIANEKEFRAYTDPVALERAQHLVDSHGRFRKLVSGSKYKVVEPVLPMDVLGAYIFLPQI